MDDDLISRKELRRAFKESGYFTGPWLHWARLVIDITPTVLHDNYSMGYQDGVKKVLSERPQGEWIDTGEEQGALGIIYKIRKCSKCSWEHSLVIPDNFCPNCGADMRGDNNVN